RLVITYSSANLTGTVFQPLPEAKPLKVYPNPANEEGVTIELDSEAPATIHLYNANGQLIGVKQTKFSKTVSLKTNGLAGGLYFVKAWQNGEVYLQKLAVR
ncbi:MAG: T9SS type A sorting domain-containing protein, partial [Phaeodactylibacter sp.]|nr:T9SS type A sorting domain-containing protein [Phaeodactylibacter sp.]